MIEYLYNKYAQKIQFDQSRMTNELLQIYVNAIEAKTGLPLNVFGFIDGTLRPTARPSEMQRAAYNGHKRVHGLKFQAVNAPDGLIVHMDGPHIGRRHDARILRESGLIQKLENLQDIEEGLTYRVYGDPAYSSNRYTLSPFRGANINDQEQAFNTTMSRVRESVEWSFGKIVVYFAFVDFKKNLKLLLQPVGKYYIVAALLTNIHTCYNGSVTSNYFDLDPPSARELIGFNKNLLNTFTHIYSFFSRFTHA
jgi:hypothetical protein